MTDALIITIKARLNPQSGLTAGEFWGAGGDPQKLAALLSQTEIVAMIVGRERERDEP